MVEFLAKNKKKAKEIAREKGFYVSDVSLADTQPRTGSRKRWTAPKKFR